METYFTKKELAAAIKKSPRFISDMCKGGFQFPATVQDAANWLRANPKPTRNRKTIVPRGTKSKQVFKSP